MSAQIDVDPLEIEFAGFDLGEVEDVVDDGQQAGGAVADRFQMIALGAVEFGIQQQFRHADDAVHRRADFVTHVGQELRLRLDRELRPILGLQQLRVGPFEIPRALRHLLAQCACQSPEAAHTQSVPGARRGHYRQSA